MMLFLYAGLFSYEMSTDVSFCRTFSENEATHLKNEGYSVHLNQNPNSEPKCQ